MVSSVLPCFWNLVFRYFCWKLKYHRDVVLLRGYRIPETFAFCGFFFPYPITNIRNTFSKIAENYTNFYIFPSRKVFAPYVKKKIAEKCLGFPQHFHEKAVIGICQTFYTGKGKRSAFLKLKMYTNDCFWCKKIHADSAWLGWQSIVFYSFKIIWLDPRAYGRK